MSAWSYQEAVGRNDGLISTAEQDRLKRAHVAIAGLGGVGGSHLATLTRLGIGNFTISDPDSYSVANTNRQYGARASTIGKNKAEVMAHIARDINPEVNIRILPEPLGPDNVDAFLREADLFIDGLDVFAIDARRLVYKKAAQKGIHSISAGPFGFSTGWIIFSPTGVSFDDYFDIHDGMSEAEQFIALATGVAPAGTHLKYLDRSKIDFRKRRGPSLGLACDLAAGVAATEATKLLLDRGRVWTAPHYHQFDPYVGRFIRRRLVGGNKNPWQRLRRRYLINYFRRRGMLSTP